MPDLIWPPPFLEEWTAIVDSEPEPLWHLQDFVPTDAAVLMSGAAKRSYKTWFAFQMVRSLASGKSIAALNPTAQTNCLVIELEGPRKQTRLRWKYLLNGSGARIPEGAVTFIHRYPVLLDDKEWLDRLIALVKARNIGFIVIDTLAKAHRGDENSVRDVSQTMRAMDQLRQARPGTSVLFLHHLNKMSGRQDVEQDIDDDIRGTSAISGFYDVHLAFRKPRPRQRCIDLTVRNSDDEQYLFAVTWSIDKHVESAVLDMKKLDVANPDPGLVQSCVDLMLSGEKYSWASLVDLWDLPVDMVDAIKNALVADGTLHKKNKQWTLKGE